MGVKISINYESDNEKYNKNEKSKAALGLLASPRKLSQPKTAVSWHWLEFC